MAHAKSFLTEKNVCIMALFPAVNYGYASLKVDQKE
jgi:hypothetical protein